MAQVAYQTLDARAVLVVDAHGGVHAEPTGALPCEHVVGIGLVEETVTAVKEAHGPDLGVGRRPGPPGARAPQRCADGPQEDPEDGSGDLGVVVQVGPEPLRDRVISDTHGRLRDEAVEALEGSALILHAGDVGDPGVLDRLARIAPVHAVHGNTDGGDLRRRLPETAAVDLGAEDGVLGEDGPRGPVAYVLHDLEQLDLDPVAAGFAVVVTGHTHRPRAERRDGVLYLNPGSAGPRRFDLPVSVARVTVGLGEPEVEIVRLEVG